jgi:phenylalanyl-tRNA synthetase beta chain
LRDAVLFDVYRPKATDPTDPTKAAYGGMNVGEKSLAVRLVLNSADATLTDSRIELALNAVLDLLTRRLGARLRG